MASNIKVTNYKSIDFDGIYLKSIDGSSDLRILYKDSNYDGSLYISTPKMTMIRDGLVRLDENNAYIDVCLQKSSDRFYEFLLRLRHKLCELLSEEPHVYCDSTLKNDYKLNHILLPYTNGTYLCRVKLDFNNDEFDTTVFDKKQREIDVTDKNVKLVLSSDSTVQMIVKFDNIGLSPNSNINWDLVTHQIMVSDNKFSKCLIPDSDGDSEEASDDDHLDHFNNSVHSDSDYN